MIDRYRERFMRFTSIGLLWRGSRPYVRNLYAVWSKFYDAGLALDPAYRRGGAALIERIVASGDRVLDVGIGTGMLAEHGAPRASIYVGLDYSGAMLAKAAKKLADRQLRNVLLRWGDAKELPYEEGAFDAVVSSFMLPHFAAEEKGAVLSEMARVLRPGGRAGLFLAQGEVYPLFSKREELRGYLEQAGFGEIELEERDHIYRIATATKPAD